MAIGLVVVAVVGFLMMRMFGGSSAPDTTTPDDQGLVGQSGTRQVVSGKEVMLQYWGLWEPNTVLSAVFAEFEKQNPGIKVQYTQQSYKDYRERLQTAVASGQGPDLFRFHASWTPMLKNELSTMPSSVITANDFKTTYYPAASSMLVVDGQVRGIPLMYDGLALLYNKEILENSGDTPPQTWAQLRTLASKLKVPATGELQRGGVALGSTTNVEGFSDVLGLLMLQNGATLSKPNSPETRDALLYYASFMKTDTVWNDTLPSSSVAFARGDVAMIFAPSWRIHEILAMNPNLKIGVAPVPKLSDKRVGWATFWAEGINAKSQNKDAAAKLLKYLSTPEVLKQMYAEASKVRAFGELYPRVDMAGELASDPLVGPYLSDAPYAEGWYMSSYTHDNGINDQIIKYYQDGLNAMAEGKMTDDVLETVNLGVTQVLRQYASQ